jgi:hypothetical protein
VLGRHDTARAAEDGGFAQVYARVRQTLMGAASMNDDNLAALAEL